MNNRQLIEGLFYYNESNHSDIINGGINYTKQLKAEGFDVLDLSPTQVLFYKKGYDTGFLFDYRTQEMSAIQGSKLAQAYKFATWR